MHGKYNKKSIEAQICKFYFFSFERKLENIYICTLKKKRSYLNISLGLEK